MQIRCEHYATVLRYRTYKYICALEGHWASICIRLLLSEKKNGKKQFTMRSQRLKSILCIHMIANHRSMRKKRPAMTGLMNHLSDGGHRPTLRPAVTWRAA